MELNYLWISSVAVFKDCYLGLNGTCCLELLFRVAVRECYLDLLFGAVNWCFYIGLLSGTVIWNCYLGLIFGAVDLNCYLKQLTVTTKLEYCILSCSDSSL